MYGGALYPRLRLTDSLYRQTQAKAPYLEGDFTTDACIWSPPSPNPTVLKRSTKNQGCGDGPPPFFFIIASRQP
uniref:Uncharacterized protein n=1 Tax=Panagrellus redivivus TaxID=6233 RepID=A0A7E4ZVW3_PANRE